MARIRTIKPDFWTDATLGECSPTARLLFIGTWNVADDHGNLERSSRQLKAQLFPYDSFDCEPLVQELLNAGVLVEYEVDSKKYLHIKGFEKHQKVEKKSNPRHPLPDPSRICSRLLPDYSPTTHRGVEVSSLEGKRKGREKEGKGSLTDAPANHVPDSSGRECDESGKSKLTPEAALAIPLREAGVKVTSMHPVLVAWVKDGFTAQQCMGAVAIARESKGDTEPIHANYLDKILRNPAKAHRPPRENGNGHHLPRSLTSGEIIERAIREGRSDQEILCMPELELIPGLQQDIVDKREEIRSAEH